MSWPLYQWTHREALENINKALLDAHFYVDRMHRRAFGVTMRGEYATLVGRLNAHISTLNRARQVPGMAQYIKDQWPGVDANFDPIAELVSAGLALLNLRNWIVDALSRFPDVRELDPEKTATFRTIAAAFLQTVTVEDPNG